MIDLHTHSTVSDGSLTPREVIELGKQIGLSAIALTDHDSVSGIDEAREFAKQVGIELIAGCEVSCVNPFDADKSCHVLLYFVDTENTLLNSTLENLKNDRDRRNKALIANLESAGISLNEKKLKAINSSYLGRPHFASLLVKKGLAKDIDEAFEKYLGQNSPFYVKKARLELYEVSELAKKIKCVCVLAHPYRVSLNGRSMEELFGYAKEVGIDGVECIYGDYSVSKREYLKNLAESFDLAITGGSDFHGDFKPGLKLGTGRGDLEVPDEIVKHLKELKPN